MEALDAYRASVATVITNPEQLSQIDRVAAFCAETVRRSGCICEPVEVHSFGGAEPRRIVGRLDPLCGVHDGEVVA